MTKIPKVIFLNEPNLELIKTATMNYLKHENVKKMLLKKEVI